jgi:hypothetical protein
MKHVVCVLLALGAIALLSAPALGDWNPGDSYKWLQLPDLSNNPSTGVDVNCTDHATNGPHRVVADDFQCTSTGPITDIHIWGSWRNDYWPVAKDEFPTFRLTLMADVPASGQGTYSHPGPVLWERYFSPGNYVSRVYAGGLGSLDEYFYDPVTGAVDWPGDHTVWQYNFTNFAQPFMQQGTLQNPVVYWLGVDAVVPTNNMEFGWKTSLQHWNDDATWQTDEMNPAWGELTYFPGHLLEGQSMDMAFVITPEPSTIVLLLSGGVALLIYGRRRRNRK